MSNREFVWTDELVKSAIKERLLRIEFGEREPTEDYVKSFKLRNTPKPLFTTYDGVDVYEGGMFSFVLASDLDCIMCDCYATKLITDDLKDEWITFSTIESATAFSRQNKKQFSLADITTKLLSNGFGFNIIESVLNSLENNNNQK